MKIFFLSATNVKCFWMRTVPVMCATARPTAKRTMKGFLAPNVINAGANLAKMIMLCAQKTGYFTWSAFVVWPVNNSWYLDTVLPCARMLCSVTSIICLTRMIWDLKLIITSPCWIIIVTIVKTVMINLKKVTFLFFLFKKNI